MGVVERHKPGRVGNGCARWIVKKIATCVSVQECVYLLGEDVENRIVGFLNLRTIAHGAVQFATLMGNIVGFAV